MNIVNSVKNTILDNVKRKTFSQEEKKAICQKVKDLIDLGMTTKKALEIIAKEYEIATCTIQYWDREYRIFSSESKVKQDWTEEEKKAICQKVKDLINLGVTIKKAKEIVAKEYDLHPDTIKVWDREYRIFSSKSEVKQYWTEEEKKAICQKVKDLINSGVTTKKALEIVAKEYKIATGTIQCWDREYRIFSSGFDGNTWTEQEKRDICYIVKARMEATDRSAMPVIAEVLAEINKRDVLKQYYDFRNEEHLVYNWNREFKYIFKTKNIGSVSKYPDNKKREILEEVNEGKKIEDVAKNHNLSVATLRRWNKRLKVYKTRKQMLDEGTQKLEQKIEMEIKVQKTNIDMVSNKQNDGR